MEGLNKRDAALLRRGYYEELIGAERFNSQLWEVNMRRPTHWPDINETEAANQLVTFSVSSCGHLQASCSKASHSAPTAGACVIRITN